jgi:hypothetical protein
MRARIHNSDWHRPNPSGKPRNPNQARDERRLIVNAGLGNSWMTWHICPGDHAPVGTLQLRGRGALRGQRLAHWVL